MSDNPKNKIVLVRPPYSMVYSEVYKEIPKNREVRPPLGLLSLAGALEKTGYNVAIIDGEPQLLSVEKIVEQIRSHNPSFLGVTSTTPEYHIALEIAELAKKKIPFITTIFGGAHVSALPEKSLSESLCIIDYIVVGEGERSIVDIVKNKPKDRIIRFPLIEDINLLPSLSKHLLDYSNYRYADPEKGLVRVDAIETSRGCPFECAFCFHFHGNKIRFKDPVRVVSEIEESYLKLGTQMFIFFDDTFTLKRDRAITICNEIIKRKLKLSFFCFTRADTLDRELLVLMKRAGFDKITLGVESGNQSVLNRIRKGLTLKQNELAYKMINGLGIETRGSFILGNPGETHQTIQDTINFAKKLPLVRIGVNILTPYPGTELYKDALEGKNGIKLTCSDWKQFKRWGRSVVRTLELSEKDLEDYQKKFLMVFYSSRKVIFYHLKKFLFSSNHSFYYYRPVLTAIKERTKYFILRFIGR